MQLFGVCLHGESSPTLNNGKNTDSNRAKLAADELKFRAKSSK